MLVPFVIDPESIAPDAAWTPAQQHAFYKSLLKTWGQIGLLFHDGENFSDSQVRIAIDKLPQKIRPLWQALLQRLPLLPCSDPWDGFVSDESKCLDLLCNMVGVALVDDVKAELVFGCPGTDLSKFIDTHPGIEACRIWAAEHAKLFEQAVVLSGQHIPAGQSYSDLWATRFRALARAPIKQVVLVDRFAASQMWRAPAGTTSGLDRFIRLLDDEALGNRYVTVYSAWTEELTQQPIVRLADLGACIYTLLSHLEKKQVKEVKLVMLPNSVFGDVHHDRFIRFSDYVWDLGVGVKIFEGAAVRERTTAAFKAGLQTDTYKDVETVLASHEQAKTTMIKS